MNILLTYSCFTIFRFGLVVVGLVFAILETMAEPKNNNGLILATYILVCFSQIIMHVHRNFGLIIGF